MSMMNAALPAPEVGETVATYKKYEGAQRAVSKLIENDVPAKEIAIVGRSLRSVEKVTGKLGWARAARQGALNGIMLGLLFAAFAIIWMPDLQPAVIGGILLIGLGFGMALRLLNYSIVRRRRDFASVMAITADHYEVAVSPAHVPESRRVLGTEKTRTVVARPPSNEPPRYGVRIDDRPRDERPAEERPAADPDQPRED
ncbi:MAG: general stress protein [Microbacterium gubbeenense]|uniref:general stress protein n=1 Tax=Microbacterium gubbeenense TaxID=159896 RepID=UPI003F9C8BF2